MKNKKAINKLVNRATITNNGTKLNDSHNTTLPNVTSKKGLIRWATRLYEDRETAKQRLIEERNRFYEQYQQTTI